MMHVSGLCLKCIRNAVRDKHFNNSKVCSPCRLVSLCPCCIEFRYKDEILKINQLTKMLLRSRAACKEHRFELFSLEMDIELCIDKLRGLSRELCQNKMDIIKIGMIISECEEKFNNLYESSCMKRAQSQKESKAFLLRTNFLFPQMAGSRNATVRKISCSCCDKIFAENDLINNLIYGHSICDTCLPKPSCKLSQDSESYKIDLKKNINTYVKILLAKFEEKRTEFGKHFDDLAEIPHRINEGLHCLNTVERLCYQSGKVKDLKVIRKEICRWEYKLKAIQFTICKTKAPGNPHNTILFDEYEWGHRLSHIYKYLHEVLYLAKNGQKIYAMNKVNGHLKFGEFSTDENHLFFNTLTLDEAEDEAYFVRLNDIKICAGTLYFPFITISWNNEDKEEVNKEKGKKNSKNHELRFVVSLHHPDVSRQFINLCTGEDGTSYQYSPYRKGTIGNESFESILYFPTDLTKEENDIFDVRNLEAPPFFRNIFDESKLVTPPLHHNNPEHYNGDIFLIGSRNGSFSVCRSLQDRLKIHSLGVVLNEVDFSIIDYENPKSLLVVNCGMQILHF